ncbi:uncharacterized protein LOC7461324 isoform X4 [Populus trichocarpa]|uniref:uncharacterized protein LOC7461324 isoform X4 n=1 Tax=Populus trichocarpa TaxID=3694 RepID=UPI000D188C17|nr:uncharacterized protein LOC7461324 isoform X4 [Populus trichocarpa]|eukprot:XP_024452607.1 uncharacterized protein LOC7461324 isoform X4 [Populus trichocarpa]
MSLSPKPLLHRLCFNELPCIYTFRVPTRFHLQKSKSPSSNLSHFQRLCSVTGDNNVSGSSGSHNKNHDHEAKLSGILPCFPGSRERSEMSRSSASNEFYVAPAPGKMGYFAAAERFLKVMAMVWAGSQVTKLVRAGGICFLKRYLVPRALALAPFVDRGLSWFTVKFKFESQEKAFIAIVGFCFGLALILFLVMTLLWA